MKKILVTGAGGSPSLNFIRSLRASEEPIHIIGADSSAFSLERSECDERYLVPPATDPQYLDILNSVIRDSGAEFLHAQNDTEIEILSENRERIQAKMFLPPKETVRICVNKYLSFEKWKSKLPQPKNIFLNTEEDLQQAFAELGNPIWIRAVKGAAGRGALKVEDIDTAKAWISFHKGWGEFVAAEYLSPQSITWQSIWYEGELIVAQGRKRLYWEFANRAPSGITGLTGAGVTVSDPELDRMAEQTILAVDPKPHGIFSADLTYDRSGVPNPTEINIARFFTTHEFFTQAGLNMPLIYLKLAYGEREGLPQRLINPLAPDQVWIRGLDFLPKLSTMDAVHAHERALAERRAGLTL